MKTQNRLFGILILVLTIGCTSCSKDEPIPPPIEDGNDLPKDKPIEVGDGISADAFETYPGDVGFVIDTRELVKKGYLPTQAVVTVEATHGNYSQTIEIDPISFMGQIKIPLEGLSEAAITELTNGVNVSSEIKDATGSTIISDPVATVTFQANPNPRTVNANNLEETTENATVNLSENTTYYIQSMNTDGTADNFAWRHLDATGYDEVITANISQFNGNEPDRGFTFVSIPGEYNTFAIRHKASLRYVQATSITVNTNSYQGNFVAPNLSNRTDFSEIQTAADYDFFKFRFEQTEDGSYSIINIEWGEDFPVKQIPGFGLSLSNWVVNAANGNRIDAEPRTWRLISTTIDWDVQNVGTTFLEPILGAAQTGFQFNSTLTNCGQGSLSQTVGSAITETRSRTIGWAESLSISSTETVGISATVGVDFDAKFFGAGATYSASITADYNYSRTVSESSSVFGEVTDEISETIFAERTVTVPSGNASLVYDVFQYYEDTKVNFVQRLRISGVDSDSGMPLTGDEIRSQFQFGGFDGVISAIEPTSVVITLRGTTVLDKIVKAESKVEDVASNCGG